MLVLSVGFGIYPLARLNFVMCLPSQISVIILFCSGSTCTNFSIDCNRMCNFGLEKLGIRSVGVADLHNTDRCQFCAGG